MLIDGIDVPTIAGTLPTYANAGDAGADLYSSETVTLPAGERRLVGTGTCVQLPENSVGFVCSRSGLAHNHGVFVLNAPGVVDSGYTGEVKVNLMNLSDTDYTITEGDRIAQLVVQTSVQVNFLPVTQEVFDELETERGDTGHGDSGQ
jgi:dUTP pyrophosphatase